MATTEPELLKCNIEFLQSRGYTTHNVYHKNTKELALVLFYQNNTDNLYTMKFSNDIPGEPGVILLGAFLTKTAGITDMSVTQYGQIHIHGIVKEIEQQTLCVCRNPKEPSAEAQLKGVMLDDAYLAALEREISGAYQQPWYGREFVLSLHTARAYLLKWAESNNLALQEPAM